MLGKGLDMVVPGAPGACRVNDDPAHTINQRRCAHRFYGTRLNPPALQTRGSPRQGDGGRHHRLLQGGASGNLQNAAGVRAVISPNMSIGVNLMFDLVRRAASALTNDYDVEIVEMHHKWKKDAPSGTAVRLRQMVEAGRPDTAWSPCLRQRRYRR